MIKKDLRLNSVYSHSHNYSPKPISLTATTVTVAVASITYSKLPLCTWAVRGLAVGGFLAWPLAISPPVGWSRLSAAPGASFQSETSTGQ